MKEKAASLDQKMDDEAGRRSIALQAENASLNAIIAVLRESLSEARNAPAERTFDSSEPVDCVGASEHER